MRHVVKSDDGFTVSFVHLLPEEGDSFILWNICNMPRW
jgi:hypothetical protein